MTADNNQSNANHLPAINDVSPPAVLRWLALGWQDMLQAGAPSLLHGLIVTTVSITIFTIAFFYWELLPGAVSGFVLIGPFLATGLYALSHRLEQGRPTSFRDVIHAWRNGSHCLFLFGLLLVVAATAWVVFSVLMFYLFIDITITEPKDFLRYVLTQDDRLFLMWTILGGLGSALAFSITVVSMPLLVERDVSTKQAILTSVRAVGNNPITMLWWSMVILFITGISFFSLMLGFIILYPVLGHASWHVYRDLVNADDLPLRPATD